MFFLRALYEAGHGDQAYTQVRKAFPSLHGPDTIARGQLPAFVPNYYRGDAGRGKPGHAMGRSSQLFNTGAASWLYRCVVEDLFGLHGEAGGLRIVPQLPSSWNSATATRQFRGAELTVNYARDPAAAATRVVVDGKEIRDNLLTHLETGRSYAVDVILPVETGA
jgi:cellobionic acid phosphorylase